MTEKQLRPSLRLFWKSKLLRQLSLSIVAFIVLIEGILLITSLRSRRTEFEKLNAFAKDRVTQELHVPSPEILTTEDIQQRLAKFTFNIIGLTLIIIAVVVIGTLVVFYQVAGKHIVKLVQLNEGSTKDNVHYYPTAEIPRNEIGDLIISRDKMLRDLQDYQTVLLRDSTVDGLTKLFNKTYTESLLVNTVKLSLRERRVFSVLLCDVDHFKAVNDKFGHAVGDEVLQMVARSLRSSTREPDVIGRVGGEEFMVILHACSITGTQQFLTRLKSNLSASNVLVGMEKISVTLSLGSITFEHAWESDLDPQAIVKDLIEKADQALYQSKQTGRNKITHFELMQDTPKRAVNM